MMVENIGSPTPRSLEQIAAGAMAHLQSMHSVWLVPVFLAAAVPVLWWRRGVLAVTGVLLGAMVGARRRLRLPGPLRSRGCRSPSSWRSSPLGLGAVAPVGRWHLPGGRSRSSLRWSWCGTRPPASAPNCSRPFWRSRLVLLRDRPDSPRSAAQLGRGARRDHNDQLRRLRDRPGGARGSPSRERIELSARFWSPAPTNVLPGWRGGRLARGSRPRTPEKTPSLLASAGGRRVGRTLDDMRAVVGLLRGGDVSLAPAPSVAHLDALVARHSRVAVRHLQVSGDPRTLPARRRAVGVPDRRAPGGRPRRPAGRTGSTCR